MGVAEKRIKCWGSGTYGRLGAGSTDILGNGVDNLAVAADEMGDNLLFIDFAMGTPDALKVFTANDITCAEFSGDIYKCWGLGNYNGTNTTLGDTPGEMATVGDLNFGLNTIIKGMMTHDRGACVKIEDFLSGDQTLRCFGSNNDGKLGRGTTANQIAHGGAVDVDLGLSSAFVPFSPSVLQTGGSVNDYNCVIGSAGGVNQIRCWGKNSTGQLGTGNLAIGDDAGEMGAALPVISMGTDGATPLVIADVSLSNAHMCALSKSGKVKCIGYAAQGQLGIGSTSDYGSGVNESLASQAIITLPLPAIQLRAVGNNSCVILSDFSVRCWGASAINGTSTSQSTPVAVNVATGRKVMGIHMTPSAICAHMNDSAVRCWGTNQSGILGLNTDTTTVIGDSAGEIAAQADLNFGVDGGGVALVVKNMSMSHSSGFGKGCARFTNNTSKCWGYNGYGGLGINSQTTVGGASISLANGPLIQTAGSFIDFSTAYYHSCAILSDFTMKCWGFNSQGERGMGNTTLLGHTAGSMAMVTTLDLGDDGVNPNAVWAWSTTQVNQSADGATCAIINPGELKCWGRNYNGILGYGHELSLGTVPAETPRLLPAVDLDF